MKLLFGTGNEFKYSLMKERLKGLKNTELVMPKMLNLKVDVIEDAKSL